MTVARYEPMLDPFPDFEPVWDNVRPLGKDHPVLALLTGQHPFSRRLDRWARVAGFSVALSVTAASAVFAVQIDLPRRFSEQISDVGSVAAHQAGFQVGEVLVSGRAQTDMDALRLAIGVGRGDPILEVDPGLIRRRIETLPWVRSAHVERQLPDIIRIRLVERVPFALWQRNQRIAVVDEEGFILPATGSEAEDALPIIVGTQAPENAPALFAILATEPALSQRVRAATWVDDRRWTLRLDNGIDVHLPAARPDAAWTRLARLDREQSLLSRDIVAVDLRLDDRLVVRLGADAIAAMGVDQDA
ncbi:MAG: cell division protein FtsQ/DivIB [Alphaproteobacteria bacterium]